MLTLLSQTSKTPFQVDRQSAMFHSKLIEHSLSLNSETTSLELDVPANILKLFSDFISFYKQEHPKPIPVPLPLSEDEFKYVVDPYSASLVDNLSPKDLFLLADKANFLDCVDLLELACAKVAHLFNQQRDDVEAIKTLLRAGTEDLTEEKLKESLQETLDRLIPPGSDKVDNKQDNNRDEVIN